MCTGSMIRPVAPMTTVKYDATYQCDGLTGNTSSGSVPNDPPMISIVTIGNDEHEGQRQRVPGQQPQLGGEQPAGDGAVARRRRLGTATGRSAGQGWWS